jgi:hypothetical protein
MQDDHTLVRELAHVVDALGEISTSTEVILVSRPEPEAHALRELAAIVEAIGAITDHVRAAFVALGVSSGETVPDVFPEEWCEGASSALAERREVEADPLGKAKQKPLVIRGWSRRRNAQVTTRASARVPNRPARDDAESATQRTERRGSVRRSRLDSAPVVLSLGIRKKVGSR